MYQLFQQPLNIALSRRKNEINMKVKSNGRTGFNSLSIIQIYLPLL